MRIILNVKDPSRHGILAMRIVKLGTERPGVYLGTHDHTCAIRQPANALLPPQTGLYHK